MVTSKIVFTKIKNDPYLRVNAAVCFPASVVCIFDACIYLRALN